MSKILLDTNAYIHLLLGNQDVFDELLKANRVFMSAIVLGELYAGFYGSRKESENRMRLDNFLRKRSVDQLPVTRESAEIFGEVKNRLKKIGKPIPINDVWIAAHTIESGSKLITFDQHFQALQGLRWRHLHVG